MNKYIYLVYKRISGHKIEVYRCATEQAACQYVEYFKQINPNAIYAIEYREADTVYN